MSKKKQKSVEKENINIENSENLEVEEKNRRAKCRKQNVESQMSTMIF
jgi:hypothetical protein